jgi:hypothetical protein
MSSILISMILSMAPYHWVCCGQDTKLKKDDLKVVMYPGDPPESLAHLSEDIRKSYGPEKPPALTAKVAADGAFKAGPLGTSMDGQITKIDGDKIEVLIKHATVGPTGASNIKATVKLNEPIIPKGFIFSSIIITFYFRIIKNTEDKEAIPAEIRPPDERPSGKSDQSAVPAMTNDKRKMANGN